MGAHRENREGKGVGAKLEERVTISANFKLAACEARLAFVGGANRELREKGPQSTPVGKKVSTNFFLCLLWAFVLMGWLKKF